MKIKKINIKISILFLVAITLLSNAYSSWPGADSSAFVHIYEDPNLDNDLAGDAAGEFNYNVPNLANEDYYAGFYITWNDIVSSLEVYKLIPNVEYVELCQDANYCNEGQCEWLCDKYTTIYQDETGNWVGKFGSIYPSDHDNKYSSLRYGRYTPDETQEACANAGKHWFGVGGSQNCCDGATEQFTADPNALCYNGAVYSCEISILGQIQPSGAFTASTNYYMCTDEGPWYSCTPPSISGNTLQSGKECCGSTASVTISSGGSCYIPDVSTAEQFSESCAKAVLNDPSADTTDIFLGPTYINRCCGDNPTLDNGYTTTNNKYVCTASPRKWVQKDLDGDGFATAQFAPAGAVDCDDNNNRVYPGAPEICDDLDNNCNGAEDETCRPISIMFFKNKSASLPVRDKFRSCNLTSFNQSQLDKLFYHPPPPKPNLTNHPLCTNLGSWYCNFNLNWENASRYNKSQPVNTKKINANLIAADFPPLSQVSCCPRNYCFNGTAGGCVVPYVNPKKAPIFKTFGQTGYRCNSAGNWTLVSVKRDYLGNDTGYCNVNTQCYANSNCFNNKQWFNFNAVDRLCINGNWTTRTKYIAAALLNYTNQTSITEFVLYCDKVNNALGIEPATFFSPELRINYDVRNLTSGLTAPYYLDSNRYLGLKHGATDTDGYCGSKPCVNNFCVLKYKLSGSTAVRTIAATSLNKSLNISSYKLYEYFGFKQKDNKTGNIKVEKLTTGNNITRIYSSGESGTLYYAKDLQVIFYTIDDPVNPSLSKVSLGEKILYFARHPIISLSSFIRGLFTSPQPISDILNKVQDFDRIYFAKKDNKIIVGIHEIKYNNVTKKVQPFIAINYTGFNDNVCNAIRNVNTTNVPTRRLLNCTSTTNSQYVFGTSEDFADIDNVWPDLTAKIRIS